MSKMVLKTYEEINATRRRTRKIFLLVSIPFIILIGLFGWKTVSMYVGAGNTINNYEAGLMEEASIEATGLKTANYFEKWVAYYDAGTVSLKKGEIGAAVSDLQVALSEATGILPAECNVRANLAIAYELMGDQLKKQGDETGAVKKYDQALQVTNEAPAECAPPSSGGEPEESDEPNAGESMENTKERIQEKKGEGEEPSDPEQDGDEPSENESTNPGEDEREKIREQMENSGKQQQENNNTEGNNTPGEGGSGGNEDDGPGGQPVDKPW